MHFLHLNSLINVLEVGSECCTLGPMYIQEVITVALGGGGGVGLSAMRPAHLTEGTGGGRGVGERRTPRPEGRGAAPAGRGESRYTIVPQGKACSVRDAL